MNKPLVSVCICTYNHVNYIEQAIDGVLMQKVNFSYELIIADDFSQDGAREKLVDYQKKNPYLIKLILQEKNVGPAKNWMDLITAPVGKYIASFDGDDYWTDPFKLQKQVDFLEANEEYSMCFHESEIRDSNNRFLRRNNNFNEDKDYSILDLTQRNFINTASVVFRKKNIENLPKLFYHLQAGDWGLHMINAEKGKIRYLKDCMSVYRLHKGGVWNSLTNSEMALKGVEVMKQLDELFNYQYHEYFSKGIEKRIEAFGIEKNDNSKIIHKNMSIIRTMRQKLCVRKRIRKIING